MVPGTSTNIMMLIDNIDTCFSIEHKSWMKLVKDAKMPHETAEVQLLQVFWWLLLLGLLLEAPSITASTHHRITPDSDLPQAAWRAYEIRLWAIKAPLNHGIPKWCWGQVSEKPYYTSVKGKIEITRVSPIDIPIDYFMNIATSTASFVHVSLPLISSIQWCWMILNSTVRSISEGRDSSDCSFTMFYVDLLISVATMTFCELSQWKVMLINAQQFIKVR